MNLEMRREAIKHDVIKWWAGANEQRQAHLSVTFDRCATHLI
jgi:hypothetical protein